MDRIYDLKVNCRLFEVVEGKAPSYVDRYLKTEDTFEAIRAINKIGFYKTGQSNLMDQLLDFVDIEIKIDGNSMLLSCSGYYNEIAILMERVKQISTHHIAFAKEVASSYFCDWRFSVSEKCPLILGVEPTVTYDDKEQYELENCPGNKEGFPVTDFDDNPMTIYYTAPGIMSGE